MAVLPIKDVVNVIVNLSPRSAVRSGFNLSMLLENFAENISLDTIGDVLGKVSESDLEYIIRKSLQNVEEQLKAGSAPVMDANGHYGVLDIEYDPLLVMRLTCEAVMFGCADFFDGNRLASVMKPLFSSLQPNPQI
jgi:hypothetical protein